MVLRKQNHTKNQEISRLKLLGKISIFSTIGLSLRSLVQCSVCDGSSVGAGGLQDPMLNGDQLAW